MGIISLNEKRTSSAKFITTGKEVSYHVSDQFAEPPAFGGITTDLEVHYDFSRSDCWNRGQSANAADYTIHNLAKDYADALFRDRSTGSWETKSSSSVWSYNSSEAGGCLQTVPSNMSDDDSDVAILIPGAYTSTTDTNVAHDLPTVSSTSSQNLFNGVGTGAFTVEFWVQIYVDHSNAGALVLSYMPNVRVGGSSTELKGNWFTYYDEGWSSASNRGDIRWIKHSEANNWHQSWGFVESPLPGAPTSGAGWSDWLHIVFSRGSGSSNNVKLYCNNSLEETYSDTNDWDYSQYGRIIAVFASTTPPARMGIWRFYKGKALTSTEVTTNWNDQKARFGH
tara:strand:+ start:693 stop:1706 length:1014 start_codon:yes stop_codon:yes gene_type:complete